MKTLILIFTLLIQTFSLMSQDRNVIWIHGLGGGNESWSTNSKHHEHKYKMKSTSPEYGSGKGVRGSSEITKEEINKALGKDATLNTNMAISHSFGGLVTRTLEMDNAKGNKDQNFGGYITVHSSHAGALLAENFKNGVAKKALNNMFNNLSDPIKKDNIDNIELFFAKFATIFTNVNDFIFALHEILNTTDQNGGFDKIGELAGLRGWLDPAKIGDLIPGSSILKELDSFNGGSGEKITIWGAEESNILRRLLSSLFIGPGNEELDIVSDEDMDAVFGAMWSLYELNSDFRRVQGTLNDFNPSTLFNGNPFHELARSWKNGSLYIRNGMETDWMISIGALRWEEHTVTEKDLTPACKNKLNGLYELLEDFHKTGEFKTIAEVSNAIKSLQNDPGCYTNNTLVIKTPVYTPTDGVVNTDSQIAGGGILFENKNCNHFEALNTKVLSDNFKRIFQDGDQGSAWFQTPKR